MTGVIAGLLLLFVVDVARADQPFVRRALDHVRRAEQALRSVAKDEGGHRDRALDKVRKAEYELEQALMRDD